MGIVGSRNVPYLWHSRTMMRPLFSFPGQDSREDVECHMKSWGMFAQMDMVGSRPLVHNLNERPVALGRALELSYDSKAAESFAARTSPVSKWPIVQTDLLLSRMHSPDVTREELLGSPFVATWLKASDDDVGELATSGREIGFQSETCGYLVSATKSLRDHFAVDAAVRLLPEVVAQLKTVGTEPLVPRDWAPALTQETGWVASTLESTVALEATPDLLARLGTPMGKLRQILAHHFTSDAYSCSSERCFLEPATVVAIASGLHLVLDAPSAARMQLDDEPLFKDSPDKELSVSGALTMVAVIDDLCGQEEEFCTHEAFEKVLSWGYEQPATEARELDHVLSEASRSVAQIASQVRSHTVCLLSQPCSGTAGDPVLLEIPYRLPADEELQHARTPSVWVCPGPRLQCKVLGVDFRSCASCNVWCTLR